jgi:hypothetical protein
MEVMIVSSEVRHSVNWPLVNALYAVLRSSRRAVTFRAMEGRVFIGLPRIEGGVEGKERGGCCESEGGRVARYIDGRACDYKKASAIKTS